jgi:uncharacterized membrane protein (DUF373 family)
MWTCQAHTTGPGLSQSFEPVVYGLVLSLLNYRSTAARQRMCAGLEARDTGPLLLWAAIHKEAAANAKNRSMRVTRLSNELCTTHLQSMHVRCARGATTAPGSQIMESKKSWIRKDLHALRLQWDMLTFYERFEQLVAHVLSFVISIIILVSLWQLIHAVISLLVSDALNPLDHAVYQTIFGMVMTLLIAMEFKHSITRVMARRDHIVQVKTVLLVALLAIARKFIILDPASAPAQIAALAFALVALGTVYWLMRQRDDPVDATIAAQAERDRVVHAQRQPGGSPREGGQSDN